MASVLTIENLSTCFKSGGRIARAVDGVSFHLDAGKTYALVGESGCGKSVTALSIMRLVPEPAGRIAGGTVRFNGRDLLSLPPHEMRDVRGNGISMVFQEPMTSLNPVFTVGTQVAEAVLAHQRVGRAEARQRTAELFRRVGIADPDSRLDDYPHQMSGGMRQRVMIAMALACRPAVLIADEPTTALDVTIQAQILDLIRDLQAELGMALLLITHDMGIVSENADRVGVMYAGRIVEEAPRDALFGNPAHPYTRLLLKSLPSRARKDAALASIGGMVPAAFDYPAGCRFHPRCPYVMDICRRESPRRFAAGAGHEAECHLLDASLSKKTAADLLPVEPVRRAAVEPSAPCLEVERLVMHFPVRRGIFKRTVGQVRAVDGVSLTVSRGETLALVGESGCGKTTVGKCIVRLAEATSGSIRLHGQELCGLSRRKMKTFRRRIQMIFQDPYASLNPRLDVAGIITEGMAAHGVGSGSGDRMDLAEGLIQKVGLPPDVIRRYPHQFSGGQRQRVSIARALAVEPELVICDEATSSLDVSVQAQILNLLRQLQADMGLAYLFITHDLSVVRYLADRVAVMYLGRVVEEGTNIEILESPAHPYTRALLSAAPQVDATGRKRIVLGGDVPSPVNPPQGCHFHPRCPHARPECSRAYPAAVSMSATHSCKCILYMNG